MNIFIIGWFAESYCSYDGYEQKFTDIYGAVEGLRMSNFI